MDLLTRKVTKTAENSGGIDPHEIKAALDRIAPYIVRTPILASKRLNYWLSGHELYFKAEMFQQTGAFKARGALNALLKLKEQGKLPEKVAAFSSGNHSQGVAWACQQLGVKATLYLPATVSKIKKAATLGYGAEIVELKTRQEAEKLAADAVTNGSYLLPPFDNDYVIEGQGTACLEALEDGIKPDAIFTPCGGGGLASGSYLATQLLYQQAKVFPVEPEIANDAGRSYKSGEIFKFDQQPNSICDGARTLAISERTFHYIKKMEGLFEASEEEIKYWTQWLFHLLKVNCEPTSTLSMVGAYKWLKTQDKPKKVLVILSGGNISEQSQRMIWEKDYLENPPKL